MALADIGLCLIVLLRGAVYSFSVPAFFMLAVYAAAIFFSGGKELFNLKETPPSGRHRQSRRTRSMTTGSATV